MRGKLEEKPEALPIAVDTPRMMDHAVPITRTMRPVRSDLRTVGPRNDWGPLEPLGSGIGLDTDLRI